jgi:hypothetical protein
MDLPEPFVDADDDETWTRNLPTDSPGVLVGEQFRDTNQDRVWTAGNNNWDANSEIWTSTTVLWVGEPAAIGNEPNENKLERICDSGRRCFTDPNQAPNQLCSNLGGALYLDYQGASFSARLRMRDNNGNCLGGGALPRHEVSAYGDFRLAEGLDPVYLRGENCFSGFERPGADDPEWTFSLPPKMPSPDYKISELEITSYFGRLGAAGAVGQSSHTFAILACY